MSGEATTILGAGGPWMDRLDASHLAALLQRDLADAEAVFAAEALPNLLPLAPGLEFDPAYYRETNPAFAASPDAECYAHWLTEGLALGQPPNPAAHLAGLYLALPAYPEGFAWAHYTRLRPQAGAHRWAALDDLCAEGFAAIGHIFPFGPADFPLLQALGIRFSMRDDTLAIRAYELARGFAPLPPTEQQHLADAYLRAGLWRPAMALYAELIAAGTADDWTLRNFIQSASRLALWAELEAGLTRAAPQMDGLPAWPEILHSAMQALFDAQMARAAAQLAAGVPEAARAFLHGLTAQLTAWANLLPVPPARTPGRSILLLAGPGEPDRTARRVTAKAELFTALDRPCHILPLADAPAALAALEGAAALLLFRTPANAAAILLASAARGRGIPVFYEDETLPDELPPLETFRGLLPQAEHEALCLDAWSRAAALALADAAMAPAPELAASLATYTRTSQGFTVPDHIAALAPPPSPAGLTLALHTRTLLFLDAGPNHPGGALLALLRRWPEVTLAVQGPVHFDMAFDAHATRIRFTEDALHGAALALIFCAPGLAGAHEAGLAWAEAAARAIPAVLLAPDTALPQLQHDEVVFRAALPASWFAAAEHGLQNAAGRSRLGTAAQEHAAALYGPAAAAAALHAALEALHA